MKSTNEKRTINFYANIFFIFIFILFIPYQEWPDANQHFSSNTFYSKINKLILDFFNIENVNFIQKEKVTFFSSNFVFFNTEKDYWINAVKLIYVIPLFYILNKLSWSLLGKDIAFAPPFIFAILHPSFESISIFFILVSFIFYKSGNIYFSIVIGFFATLIDRSMVPAFCSIISMLLFSQIRCSKTQQLFFFYLMIIIIINFSTLNTLKDYFFNFYNLSAGDIIYLNTNRDNSFFKLLLGLSGLYGWMSLRPTPWLLYYFAIILFFVFGLTKIDHQKKIELFISIFVAFFLLLLLPALHQPRYFPLLILLFWETVLVGLKSSFGRTDLSVYLIMLSTALGLFLEI